MQRTQTVHEHRIPCHLKQLLDVGESFGAFDDIVAIVGDERVNHGRELETHIGLEDRDGRGLAVGIDRTNKRAAEVEVGIKPQQLQQQRGNPSFRLRLRSVLQICQEEKEESI